MEMMRVPLQLISVNYASRSDPIAFEPIGKLH